MTEEEHEFEQYERYEALYDPAWEDPFGRQRKGGFQSKKSRREIVADLADDTTDIDLGFSTTYRPSRYEQGWLLSSLHTFYDEGLITDVLAQVKGGKEASVYLCEANPAIGLELVAAKVYRPRMFRNLRNDKMYRQGREILVSGGKPAGRDSGYIERAIRSKSAFGLQSAHTSWLMYEFTALERLHAVGAAVPQPIASSDNAILMSYHGDEMLAAPTLNTVRLEPDEANDLFEEVLRNVDLMLRQDLIHGDLSAYNMLYWEGELVVIDFPQVVNLHNNRKARFILKRDIARICEYFAQQGVLCYPRALFTEFWQRYVEDPDPEDMAADQSRLEQSLADLVEEAGGKMVRGKVPGL